MWSDLTHVAPIRFPDWPSRCPADAERMAAFTRAIRSSRWIVVTPDASSILQAAGLLDHPTLGRNRSYQGMRRHQEATTGAIVSSAYFWWWRMATMNLAAPR